MGHQLGAQLEQGGFVGRKAQIGDDIAAGFDHGGHGLFTHLPVAFGRQCDVRPTGLLRCLVEGMQDINGLRELGDIDHPLLALDMDTCQAPTQIVMRPLCQLIRA
jgi:hypothetical protein